MFFSNCLYFHYETNKNRIVGRSVPWPTIRHNSYVDYVDSSHSNIEISVANVRTRSCPIFRA